MVCGFTTSEFVVRDCTHSVTMSWFVEWFDEFAVDFSLETDASFVSPFSLSDSLMSCLSALLSFSHMLVNVSSPNEELIAVVTWPSWSMCEIWPEEIFSLGWVFWGSVTSVLLFVDATDWSPVLSFFPCDARWQELSVSVTLTVTSCINEGCCFKSMGASFWKGGTSPQIGGSVGWVWVSPADWNHIMYSQCSKYSINSKIVKYFYSLKPTVFYSFKMYSYSCNNIKNTVTSELLLHLFWIKVCLKCSVDFFKRSFVFHKQKKVLKVLEVWNKMRASKRTEQNFHHLGE